jgi:fucose 4-O-acetylase-like acetyltransferase
MLKSGAEIQSSRLHFLDYARGCAIISVLCYHIFHAMDKQFLQKMNIVADILSTTSYLPMFFIISGTLCGKTINNKLNTTTICISKFAKYSLLPFFSLSILFFILHAIGSHYSNNFKSINSMTTALTTLTISQDLPSGVLWFLFTLFLCYMTAILWNRYLKVNLAILLLFSFIIKIFEGFFYNIKFLSIDGYVESLCYFVFGLYFSQKLLNLHGSLRSITLYSVTYIILISGSFYYGNNGKLFLLLSSFIGPLSVLLIFRRLEIFHNNIALKIIEFIGINSLVIYAFHSSCFKFISPMIYRMGLENSYTGFLLSLIAGIVCPLLIGELLSRFPRFYKILLFRTPPARFEFSPSGQ